MVCGGYGVVCGGNGVVCGGNGVVCGAELYSVKLTPRRKYMLRICVQIKIKMAIKKSRFKVLCWCTLLPEKHVNQVDHDGTHFVFTNRATKWHGLVE